VKRLDVKDIEAIRRWRLNATVAPMHRDNERGSFGAFDVIVILVILFGLFGISLLIAAS
jgi:hypothetical protein